MQPVNISCQMSIFMPKVLPTDNEWNVYPSELEKGRTHGKMFAVEFSVGDFRIVKECIDSGHRPSINCDFWLIPEVKDQSPEKPCRVQKQIASVRKVFFKSFRCEFTSDSSLSDEQRLVITEAIEQACTKHVSNTPRTEGRRARLLSPSSSPEKQYISFR